MARSLLLLAGAGLLASPASAAPQGPVIITSVSGNACDLPALPNNARVVAFSAYEGDYISSSVIGDEDQETNVINVVIEPGSQPLYVVLSSYESMVWRFSGATKRVVQVVATSSQTKRVDDGGDQLRKPRGGSAAIRREGRNARNLTPAVALAGVTGIPRSAVYISKSNCPRYASKAADMERVIDTLAEALGSVPQAAYTTYSASQVHLPSGLIEKASAPPSVPKSFDAEQWKAAYHFWPGGLATINPKQVVAAAEVQRYRVLPSQMGIAQLVGSGAIKPLSTGGYRVVHPIPHMPPGMGGAHSITLRFAPGVPVPPGDPVHSCVVQEETGAESGATCFLRRR